MGQIPKNVQLRTPYPNELMHSWGPWKNHKYIKKYTNAKGKWVYVYATDSTHRHLTEEMQKLRGMYAEHPEYGRSKEWVNRNKAISAKTNTVNKLLDYNSIGNQAKQMKKKLYKKVFKALISSVKKRTVNSPLYKKLDKEHQQTVAKQKREMAALREKNLKEQADWVKNEEKKYKIKQYKNRRGF